MSDIYRILGAQVRRHRKRLGWTQEELAERCHMHPAYVGQIERGVKKISLAALERLSKALGARIGDLLDESLLPGEDAWEAKLGGLLRDKSDSDKRLLYSTLRHMARQMRRRK